MPIDNDVYNREGEGWWEICVLSTSGVGRLANGRRPRSRVNGFTSQWTRTHVCVVRETAPPYHPFWVRASDVRRR